MIRPINANRVWLGLVLVHMAASYLAVFAAGLNGSMLFLTLASWLFFCICHKSSQRACAGTFPRSKDASFLSGVRQWEISRQILLMLLIGLVSLTALHFYMDLDGQLLVVVNLIELAYGAWICSRSGVSIGAFCGIRIPEKPLSLLLMVPAAAFLYVISGYVNVLSLFFFKGLNDRLIEMNGSLLGVLVSLALLPAVVEEIFFRGLIFRSLGGERRAVIVSALCFAFLHMNFNQMSYAFIMGIFFAWIVWKTDNLLTTVIIHVIFNSITILSNYFGGTRAADDDGAGSAGQTLMSAMADNSTRNALLMTLGLGLAICALCMVLLILVIRQYCKMNGNRVIGSRSSTSEGGFNESDIYGVLNESRVPDEMMEELDGPEGSAGDVRTGNTSWKPDVCFFIGCLICLVYAALIEWLA